MVTTYSWGLIFVIVGCIMLVNALFGLNLPIVRLIFASLFIYLGLSMLDFNKYNYLSCSFLGNSCMHTTVHGNEKYRVNFDTSIIDLRTLGSLTDRKKIIIKAHCAHVTLIIPKEIPTVLCNHALFSNVQLSPLLKNTEKNYKYQNFNTGDALLKVSLEGAFNTIVIQDV